MDLHNDDQPVGRILSRREVLTLLGGAGAAVLAGAGFTNLAVRQIAGTATPIPVATEDTSLPACVVRPAETEGPYFVDEMLNRSDIRSDPSTGLLKDGATLYLTFRVSQIGTNSCTPLTGAQVDVWHADAAGQYSDESDPGFNTVGQKWLRGYQVTDSDGIAKFTTIYPGWYQGRTVHIHFKIRTDPTSNTGYEFTSQLFFDDTLTDQVFAEQPYAAKGIRTLRNDGDGIYANGGDQLLLNVIKTDDGYAATFDIGLDLSQPQSANNSFGGGAPLPGGGRPGQPPQPTNTPAST